MSRLGLEGLGSRGQMDARRLSGYLYQLTEQLRYVLNNLEEENFGEGVLERVESQAAAQAQQRVADQLGNYATISHTAQLIATQVGAADGRISLLEQTAQALAAQVEDAEGNASQALQTAAALSSRVTAAEGDASEALQTASALTSRVTSAEGNASQALQTASSLSSRVTSAEGNASQALQTAGSLSSSVSNLSGRVSLLEQSDSEVAVKLRDDSVSSTFEVRVSNQSAPLHGGSHTFYGIALSQNGVTQGGLYAYDNALLLASGDMLMTTSAGSLYFGSHPSSGSYGMICSMDLLPQTGDLYCLGGDGNGQRWKRLYTNNSVSVSDRREKHDIAPLDVPGLLEKLRPVRYRLNEEKEGKLRFGFVAQEVEEALRDTGYADAALLVDHNPQHLGLLYAELIAPLVEGWQRHRRQIAALREDLQRLQERLDRLESRRLAQVERRLAALEACREMEGGGQA